MPGATISFSLDRQSRVTVELIDSSGVLVRRLFDGMLPMGTHELTWDGKDHRSRHLDKAALRCRMLVRLAGGAAHVVCRDMPLDGSARGS
ncbi:hypothetical protein JXA88_07625 [Candidatus Fermentibacteria bacterium]|nr:hypothetical protein [Candidatus Fermentibacteria bacterium]